MCRSCDFSPLRWVASGLWRIESRDLTSRLRAVGGPPRRALCQSTSCARRFAPQALQTTTRDADAMNGTRVHLNSSVPSARVLPTRSSPPSSLAFAPALPQNATQGHALATGRPLSRSGREGGAAGGAGASQAFARASPAIVGATGATAADGAAEADLVRELARLAEVETVGVAADLLEPSSDSGAERRPCGLPHRAGHSVAAKHDVYRSKHAGLTLSFRCGAHPYAPQSLTSHGPRYVPRGSHTLGTPSPKVDVAPQHVRRR